LQPWQCLLPVLASCSHLSLSLNLANLLFCKSSALILLQIQPKGVLQAAVSRVVKSFEADRQWHIRIRPSARLCELMQCLQGWHVSAHRLQMLDSTNGVDVPLDLSSHCKIGAGPFCSDHAGPRFGALQGAESLHLVPTIFCQALMHIT
jgi:hypothetical protein